MGNIVRVFMPSPTMLWVAVLMLMWHSRLSMPCKPAERYDCEERYVMVKVTVDFQYVINYTSQKFFDSWASKNSACSGLKRCSSFNVVQYLQYIYGELVRVFFALDMLQR